MHSADYLADNFERYPLLLFGFASDDVYSVFPALWSAMLSARGEGIGSCFTRMLAGRAADTFEVLGVPVDEDWQMAGASTFGYPTGRWGVAERLPVEDVTFRNRWSEPLGFEVGGPLYP